MKIPALQHGSRAMLTTATDLESHDKEQKAVPTETGKCPHLEEVNSTSDNPTA